MKILQAIAKTLRKIRDVFLFRPLVKRVEEVEQLQKRAEAAREKCTEVLGELSELNRMAISQTQNIHIHTVPLKPCDKEVTTNDGDSLLRD